MLSPEKQSPEATFWYQKYESITDPESHAFIKRSLEYAKQLLGDSNLPINKVHLCLSTPLDSESNFKRNFQLCEIADAHDGVFAIYLSQRPNSLFFRGQLAHEVAHLLNAKLFDVYVEGLNTVFAERMILSEGGDWSGWRDYLVNKDAFYGSTYLMMREVWEIVGDQHIKTILSFAVYADGTDSRMHIEIQGWVASLPAILQTVVSSVISKHALAVRNAMGEKSGFSFAQP